MIYLQAVRYIVFLNFVFLLVFVISKKHKSKLNRVTAFFVFSMIIWSLSILISEFSENVILWLNIGAVGWIGFPSLFLCQTCVLTERKKILQKKFIYIVLILIPSFLIYMQWSGNMIESFEKCLLGWNNVWSDSIWPTVYFSYYTLFLFFSFSLLNKYKNQAVSVYRKKQVMTIIYSVIIVFLLGTVTDVILPRRGIYSIPTMASAFSVIWGIGMVYGIYRYGFLSITPETAASDIIYSMADALILCNFEGNIVTVNKTTLSLLGYSRQEIIGKPSSVLFKEPHEELFRETILVQLVNQGSVRKKDMAFQTKRGKVIPVNLSGSIVRGSRGEMAGVLYIARDMREIIKKNKEVEELYKHQANMREKLIEAKMKEKLKRQEKLAMIGRLTGSVGHEVRTPLSSIKNAIYYLKKYGSELGGRSGEYLDILSKEVDHIQEIVESLMDFSRSTKLDIQEVRITEVVDEVISSLKIEKSIKIVKNIPPEADRVNADFVKLKQLLENLFKNSCQSITETGKVCIKTEKTNSGIIMVVEDTGEGMGDEMRSRLFDPLYTTKSTGVGLGMAIVKDIVDAHKWNIKVESQKGTGTKFIIIVEENEK